jgi:hypothetical protein
MRRSKNAKTGDMLQTYIVRADVHPWEALKSGADESVCGGCQQRPYLGGACYVNVAQAPSVVYKAFKRGTKYPTADGPKDLTALGRGRAVRLGSYGDPAAVPKRVWQALLREADSHTGYTRQWRRAHWLKDLCMASVDSPSEAAEAQARGWRTFRVRREDQPVQTREFTCPASDEAGNRRSCATCKACNGTSRSSTAASPVIVAHGFRAALFFAQSI